MQKSPDDTAEKQYLRGKRYLDFGEREAAQDSLRRALDLDPSYVPAWLLLGQIHEDQGNTEKSLECYKTASKLNPESTDIMAELGLLQFRQKQYTLVVRTLNKYMKKGGSDVGALLALAKAALELDHCRTVFDATAKILDIDDELYQAWELRGICQARKFRYNAALTSLTIAAEINPGSASVLNLVGNLCYDAGSYERAVEFYAPSLSIDGEQKDIIFRFGIALWFLERWKEALPLFEKYAQLAPDDARGWNNLGVAYREKGEVKKSMECYMRALAIDPHLEIVKSNMETATLMQVIP
jgi:protein O-GlcNAc transferase